MSIFKKLLLTQMILVLLMLMSCDGSSSDDDAEKDDGSLNYRITKYSFEEKTGDKSEATITYDDDGNVKEMSSSHIKYTVLELNADNYITKYQRIEYNEDGSVDDTDNYLLEYNANNQIVKLTENDELKYEMVYDSENKLKYMHKKGDDSKPYTQYEYDNGKIVKTYKAVSTETVADPDSKITFEYNDDNKLASALYEGYDDNESPPVFATEETTIEYDADGKIVSFNKELSVEPEYSYKVTYTTEDIKINIGSVVFFGIENIIPDPIWWD